MRTGRLVAVAAALLVAGCGAEDGMDGSTPDASTSSGPSSGPSPTAGPSPTVGASATARPSPTSAPTGAAALAAEDLADRLGVAVDVVEVTRVEEVTWRDASLGCPQPGMAYAQVLTNGTLVVLEVDGTTYEYHAGGPRAPFLCENPQAPL